MADKNGDPQQCRNARFSKKPMANPGVCPFKGPDIAIVPMRYALDRSRYDVDPARLTPLSAEGKWKCPPKLRSRSYTLRQLRNGFVYVYDETDQALHEYRFNAQDASLTRIDWGGTEPGQDIRSAEGASRTYLVYPRGHKLRLAFSPFQWTERMCRMMSSSGVKRASWLRELDLRDYSRQMSVWHALPLTRLSNRVVADVDPYPIDHDGRFADSAHPPEADVEGKYPSLPLAADVVWTGSVDDKFSAVLIALDDPLAMLEDLSMQLAADQAALHAFQAEHEHALNIAGVVDNLCGVGGDKTLLPASVLEDETRTRQYVRDIEAYFEQLQIEDDIRQSADGQVLGLVESPSAALGQDIKTKYGSLPDPALRESWQGRSKWRREVDLDAARDYADIQQVQLKSLREQVTESQDDIKALAAYIGTDPIRLFIDTTSPVSLLCLLDVVSDLLCNLSQDLGFSHWLQQEEGKSKTLFGRSRFGFSQVIKDAMTDEASRLIQGASDLTTLAGRAGELNGFLTHDSLAEKPWVKALAEPARMTLDALVDLAKDAGKTTLENIQLAFFPVDSRLSKGTMSANAALMLRNLVIGHVLLDHPEKLQINEDFAKRHAAWKAGSDKLRNLYQTGQYRWLYQAKEYDRRATAKLMQDIQRELKLHLLKEPLLLDYRSQRYGEAMQGKIADFFARNGQLTKDWNHQAKAWSAEHGLNAVAITWGIAAINLFNTLVTYENVSRDGELSKKDWAKVTSAAAYTGNALMAVFVETGWRGIKDLGAPGVDGKYKKITQQSAAQWRAVGRPEFGKLIKGFGPRLIGLGGFAVVAASLELWDILDDLKGATGANAAMLELKGWATLGVTGGGLLQLLVGALAAAGDGRYVVVVTGPWFVGFIAVVGLIYLFATFALNRLKRDTVGDWLRKCRWSRFPAERFSDQHEEVLVFHEIQISPALFLRPITGMKLINVGDLGYQLRELPIGAWLQLRISAELRGETICVNLLTSYRPARLMPVKALSGSLQKDFLSNGCSEVVGQWGNTPDKKFQPHYGISGTPRLNEDVIWQTWIPLDERAKYLEVQVWYPEEILATRKGDRGYRFQMELAAVGMYDDRESRLLEAGSSSLEVEKLGGRGEGAILPVF